MTPVIQIPLVRTRATTPPRLGAAVSSAAEAALASSASEAVHKVTNKTTPSTCQSS